MVRPAIGEWIVLGVFALIFSSVYCIGAVEECETNVRTCARCNFVLGLLDYTKQKGTQAIDAVD
jgi:hypothetical protein